VILIDANILMYAAGKDHPAKEPSARLVRQVARGGVDVCLDAEVLQEIPHRYWGIKRPADGKRVYDSARRLIPEVLPITAPIVDRARTLLDLYPHLSARDALHSAVVLEHILGGICSFDGDFDQVDGVVRFLPEQLTAEAPLDSTTTPSPEDPENKGTG
jgi:predicted nucleic acid-binding protein